MPDPWDIPSIPAHGDKSATDLFAAIGRALSEWEELELYLARVYAMFLGVPPIKAIEQPEYKNAPTFSMRAKVIEEAAERHFIAHPNQQREGEFQEALCGARKLANRRNDIAHGVARLSWGEFGEIPLADALARAEIFLGPARYRAKQFDKLAPEYLFSSVEVLHFAEQFRSWRMVQIEMLLAELWHEASPEKRPPPPT